MRKRSKYKPRPVLADPVGYVLERFVPIRAHDTYLIDLKIKNHEAMRALLRGEAGYVDMDVLIACSNITEALYQLGFGKEYGEVCVAGREALIAISHRAAQHKRFTPTGTEIQQLNDLMELHDAQMDVITIQDMERALDYARKMFQTKKGITYLPRIQELK